MEKIVKTDVQLFNLVKLPERTSGKMSIRHEPYGAGRDFTVVSMRTSVLTGERPGKIIVLAPGHIHQLMEKGKGMWMSDLPCEIWQHAKFVPELFGNVLIGGLGIGLILKLLESNPRIKSVTVVEKSEDVISLVWDNLNLLYKANIVNADLFKFLRVCPLKFNSAYYDIWTHDGAMDWENYVLPLRYLSRKMLHQDKIYCWQESVMLGQILRIL